MGKFVQLVVDGLSQGSIYGALALAIVLVNQATGLINFAQGGMAVLSAYIAWALNGFGVPIVLAILGAIVVSFFLGALIERYLIRRFERGDPDTAVVVTIGLLTFITGLCAWIWTYNNRLFPSLFPLQTIQLGGAVISVRSLGTIVVIVVIMLLLQALFLGTKLGLALRAVAINPASAAFSGINVGRSLMVGWGLAAVLGAVAGLMAAPTVFLDPSMMLVILIYAFAAAVLGGIDSPVGAVVGGLLLGVIVNLLGAYVDFVGAELRLPTALAILLLVLIIRPQGLFGHVAVRRV